ncbi:MAG: hypothetical protein HC786_01985 [Richelia sp. CSU_2_1]|nr:hypothetical protein [Richelia sp. CSU_2_1]
MKNTSGPPLCKGAEGDRNLIVKQQSVTANHQLPITNYQLPITNYQ